MTSSHGLKSINCTSCGAGLSVLGGGRVQSHACGYCGAVLDTQDNYKILDNIGKRDHPASPITIGMTLKHMGVAFTVIGTLGIMERYKGRTWRWVEHQVFSPTHGYLWLNVEKGQVTFTRKVRDYNMSHWLSPSTVERAETPPRRSYAGQTYKYYETSVTQIEFMEGEFNWVPKLGEKKQVVSLLGPDAMLGLSKSPREREVELTKLLDRDAVAKEMGFAASALGQAERHPLEPYRPMAEEGLLRKVLGFTAVASVLLALVFMVLSGRTVLNTPDMLLSELPESYSFEVTNRSQLSRVRLESNIQNAWGVFAVEVLGPDGNPVVAAQRAISYYSGRDSDGSWSEGSRNASFRFRPETTGTHTLRLERAEGGNAAESFTLGVRVSEGKPTAFWLFVLAAITGLGWLYVTGRRAMHNSRRFAGSDWTDED